MRTVPRNSTHNTTTHVRHVIFTVYTLGLVQMMHLPTLQTPIQTHTSGESPDSKESNAKTRALLQLLVNELYSYKKWVVDLAPMGGA